MIDYQEICDKSFTDDRFEKRVNELHEGFELICYEPNVYKRQSETYENQRNDAYQYPWSYTYNSNDSRKYGTNRLNNIPSEKLEVYNYTVIVTPTNRPLLTNIIFCFKDFFGKKVWVANNGTKYDLYDSMRLKFEMINMGRKNKLKEGFQRVEGWNGIMYYRNEQAVLLEVYNCSDDDVWCHSIMPSETEAEYNCNYIRAHILYEGEYITLTTNQTEDFLKQLVGTEAEEIYRIYVSLLKDISTFTKEDKENVKVAISESEKYLKPIIANTKGVVRAKSVAQSPRSEDPILYISPNIKDEDLLAYANSLTKVNGNFDYCMQKYFLVRNNKHFGFYNRKAKIEHAFIDTEYGKVDYNNYSKEKKEKVESLLRKQLEIMARLKSVEVEDLLKDSEI